MSCLGLFFRNSAWYNVFTRKSGRNSTWCDNMGVTWIHFVALKRSKSLCKSSTHFGFERLYLRYIISIIPTLNWVKLPFILPWDLGAGLEQKFFSQKYQNSITSDSLLSSIPLIKRYFRIIITTSFFKFYNFISYDSFSNLIGSIQTINSLNHWWAHGSWIDFHGRKTGCGWTIS